MPDRQAVPRAPLRPGQGRGPLDALVAPPYDVISDERAARVPRAQPVQRRPPDAAGLGAAGRRRPERLARAGRARRGRARRTGGWRRTTSAPTASPARARASPRRCPSTPYSAGEVLPHERTHAGPKEGRLRLLRATRTQLEPIFLLYDAEPVLDRPGGEPDAGRRGGRRPHACLAVPSGELTHRHAAADRRRPSPLRDRRRLPRGGADRDAHLRDPRLLPRARRSRSSRRTGSSQEVGDVPGRGGPGPGRRSHALSRRPLHARRRPTTTSARASSSRSTREGVSLHARTPTRRSPPSTAATPQRRSCCSR